jgi:ATP/ADP translocase
MSVEIIDRRYKEIIGVIIIIFLVVLVAWLINVTQLQILC